MDFPLVLVDGFTPGIPAWSTVGNIDQVTPDATGRSFRLAFGNRSLQLTVLGPRAFRLRFNPAVGAVYAAEYSVAVVSRDLGLAGLNLNTVNQPAQLSIDTGSIRIQVGLTRSPSVCSAARSSFIAISRRRAFSTSPTRKSSPSASLLRAPRRTSVAGKSRGRAPPRTGTASTSSILTISPTPENRWGRRVAPSIPANPCTVPFRLLVEANPAPAGAFAGAPYACGVFLDNTAQSFINVGKRRGRQILPRIFVQRARLLLLRR